MSATVVQRMRQGQARCQQPLLSLLHWHQQQLQLVQAADGAAAHHGPHLARGFADQAAAFNFAKERKDFQRSLGELRKQWAQERQEREGARAVAERAQRLALDAAKAQRQQQALESKEQRKADFLAAQSADREIRLAAKAERVKRSELRMEVLGVAREERRRQLLRLSANWVTPQTLDQRILEALDNPLPLHAE